MILFTQKKDRFFEKFGLAGRVAALACIISLLLTIPGVLIGARISLEKSNKAFDDYRNQLEMRVQHSSGLAVWNYAIDVLEKFVSAELQDKNLSSLKISFHDNTLIWLSRQGEEIVQATEAPRGKYIMENVIPIHRFDDAGQVIAYATIWYDRSESRNRFYEGLVQDIMRINLSIFFITAVSAFILNYILVQPLERIRMSMIAAGRASHRLVMEKIEPLKFKKTFPEIQGMAEDLEHMLQEICAAQKKSLENEQLLKKLNDELEAKVAERTSELEKTIEDLEDAQHQMVEQEKMVVLGRLVAGIAHELNTPLGVITSAGGTLERIIESEMPQVIGFCANAPEEAVHTYKQLVEQGLDKEGQDFLTRRKTKKMLYSLVEEKSLPVPDEVIELLADIGYDGSEEECITLMGHPGSGEAIKMAYSFLTMKKSVKMVRMSAEKASKVISALKTYSHRHRDNKIIPHDVIGDIEVVLTLYYNQLKYGVEVIKNYAEVPPVLCFPDRLYQVWVNIISNALHAMKHQGRLEISVAQIEREVKVSITDNGPGIPQAILHRVFEPFFTTKGLGEGTGLGLDITKRILDEIGGRIDVETRPGKTTFTVWLKTE